MKKNSKPLRWQRQSASNRWSRGSNLRRAVFCDAQQLAYVYFEDELGSIAVAGCNFGPARHDFARFIPCTI